MGHSAYCLLHERNETWCWLQAMTCAERIARGVLG
jgi:hypothetical protein